MAIVFIHAIVAVAIVLSTFIALRVSHKKILRQSEERAPRFENKTQRHATCIALARALSGQVFFPESRTYADLAASYWSTQARERKPRCVVRPRDAAEVSVVVSILRLQGSEERERGLEFEALRFAVKSGGHSPEPESSSLHGGVLIDLSLISEVVVAADMTSVEVGSGARWLDVSSKLDGLGLAAAGARTSSVGVGGLTLGGGIAFFSPRVGFVCSNVLKYEVVLADGKIVEASESEKTDLWRALKGGSNNFGIVTRFTLRVFSSTPVWGGYLYYSFGKASQALRAFYEVLLPHNFDEYAAGPILSMTYVQPLGVSIVATHILYTKPEAWPQVWRRFKAIARLWSTVKLRTLTNATQEVCAAVPTDARQFQMTTTIENDLDTLHEFYKLFLASMSSAKSIKGLKWSLIFQALPTSLFCKGYPNVLGLTNRRDPLVVVQLAATWQSAMTDKITEDLMRSTLQKMESTATSRGTLDPFRYLNYSASGQRPFAGYGRDNLQFLRETSCTYDPGRLFQRMCVGMFKLEEGQGS